MDKIDARKQTREELHARRQHVIRLHLEKVPVMQIVKQSGLSWPAVKVAIKLYESGDDTKLKPEQRGRKQGTGRILSEQQENQLRYIIYRKRPWQAKIKDPSRNFKLSMWNRDAIKRLIHQQFGILLSDRGVDKYLQRWGFPTRKQNQRPIKRCKKVIRGWLAEHYDGLRQRAIGEYADIYWVSRKKLEIGDYVPPPQEKKPRRNQIHREINVEKSDWKPLLKRKEPKGYAMISAIDNHRKEHWLIVRGKFTEEKQINFLQNLIHTSRAHSFLIRSNSDYFTGRDVSYWLKNGDKKKIELFPPLLQKEIEKKDKSMEARIRKRKPPKERPDRDLYDNCDSNWWDRYSERLSELER